MVNVGLSWTSMVNVVLPPIQPVLGQVTFGGNPAAFLGIALVAGGAGLYFLRTLRPQLARDHDIAFSAIALLCGAILFFQGWRLDPILAFGNYLLAGSAAFFAFETIRLRGATTEQAKRSTPLVDDERPVSRVYRAELDDLPLVDERPATRRIRGTKDSRSSQTDDYVEDTRRRPSSRSSDRNGSPSDRPRKRRSSRDDRPDRSTEVRSAWDDDLPDDMSSRSTSRPSSRNSDPSSRSRRPRPSDQSSRRRPSSDPSSDYVDYQPIDYSDDEIDNSSNFD